MVTLSLALPIVCMEREPKHSALKHIAIQLTALMVVVAIDCIYIVPMCL